MTGCGGGAGPILPSSPYWEAPPVGSENRLGAVRLPGTNVGTVILSNPIITSSLGALVCRATAWNSSLTQLTITYSLGSKDVHVTVFLQPTSLGLSARITADQPVITQVEIGEWNPEMLMNAVPVPYYTGDVWYSRELSQFVNAWWDWRATNASILDGGVARYTQLTTGSLNLMNEVLQVAVSSDVDAVFPNPGNPPSPYLATLAGRSVLDIWDTGFAGIQQNLALLGDFGISHCVAIIHNWQNAGYDNGLPEHYPANPSLGGSPGIEAAIRQASQDGCLVALHENYVDYYPNYPDFNVAAVALNDNGTEMDGWYNTATKIQSFSTKPSWMLPNAQTQSPVIHQTYGTTADFIDVLSSEPIFARGDYDSGSPGAGKLTTSMEANQELWAYERQTHGGPVLGEGMDHWYYSGLLDGVEAQTGAGSFPMNTDAHLPLFVDFDLLRIHPLQVNHGMGYYQRWTSDQSTNMSTTQLDAYRMQEVAFGHAPFLSNGIWSDLPIALQESNLVSPVAANYGTALASSIQYQVTGAWAGPSVAAPSGSFDQVQVTYNNGTSLVANAASTTLNWNGLTLPQYGWAAQGPDLKAYTAECGPSLCDYAQTATTYFANARNQADFEAGSGYAAPSVKSVTPGPNHTFQITYLWQVHLPLAGQPDFVAFVHFVDDSEVSSTNAGIVFQGDHSLATPTASWNPGQTVADGPWTVQIPASSVGNSNFASSPSPARNPSPAASRTFSIRVGLWDTDTGQRLLLSGNNDGTNRYIVGYVTVNADGTSAVFTPPAAPPADPRLNSAGAVLDFGAIKTDGMVSITQSGDLWVLRPYPRYRDFTLLLRTASFPVPASVQAVGGTDPTVAPVPIGDYWTLPLNGATYYTWPAN